MKRNGTESDELIKLDIAMGYPVKWDFEKILRDLIQNFYDSIGNDKFGQNFIYRYELNGDSYSLRMETHDRPFEYQWLVYVGGSTKTGNDEYIGQYGEGFKVSMLGLLKDGITDVVMHSKDWSISPCQYDERVENKRVPMLGYRYREVADDGVTSLVINGIPQSYKRFLDEGLLHFFYKGNPLFGSCVTDTKYYSIYEASGMTIPSQQPDNLNGILYINHLARGRLSIPFFINIADLERDSDTRQRKILEQYDTMKYVYELALLLSPEESLLMLIKMKQYWNDMPHRLWDTDTWYYCICQLVRNVASSEATLRTFKEEYADLAYIERKNSDRIHNQMIDQIRVWARENNHKKLVNPIFRMLGAENLADRFDQCRVGEPLEKDGKILSRISIIRDAFMDIVPSSVADDINAQAAEADIVLSTKDKSVQDPLIFAVQLPSSRHRKSGFHPHYSLKKLIFSKEDFDDDSFNITFVKYADKMLHIYGSSRSDRMNVIFTELGAWIISGAEKIEHYRRKWIKVGTDNA